jgi:fucose permease
MPSTHRRSRAWIGVALSFYAFIAIGIAEGGLGVLIPSIQATYQFTAAAITLLFISQITGYVAAALASSLLSSRIGLARMLLLAAVSLTIALLIYALSPVWSIMVAAGTLLGLGIGLIDAGINTYIASDQANAGLTGWLHAFYGIGALLGPAVAATLLSMQFQWRLVYLVFATTVGLLIVGLLWAIGIRYAPLLQRPQVSQQGATSLKDALRTPAVLLAGLLLFVYVGTESSVGNWAYSVENISRNVPDLLAGYTVSAYWLGLTLGRISMGRMVRRLGAIRTLDCSLLLLTIALLAWWLLPNQRFSLPLIGFALGPIFPVMIWLMPQRISIAIVPAAIGFMTSLASLGAATIPTAVGWIATQVSLEIIPTLMLPLAILMVVLHRWISQRAATQKA